MTIQPKSYPPLQFKHKVIFATATLTATAYAIGLSLGRLSLIYWWLRSCDSPSTACTLAEVFSQWWWIALIGGIFGIAYTAHRLTFDRLT